MKVFSDPVHDYVSLENEIELRVVHSAFFQRLRYIHQNGPAFLVYPSLTGSRFEHSLGAAHLATQMFESIMELRKYAGAEDLPGQLVKDADQDIAHFIGNRPAADTRQDVRTILRLVTLMHDIGHLPFSHTSEEAFRIFMPAALGPLYTQMKFHELVTAEIWRQQAWPVAPWIRKSVLLVFLSSTKVGEAAGLHKSVFSVLKQILDSEIDCDRGDYILRDGRGSGRGFGSYDNRRLVDSLQLSRDPKAAHMRVCVGIRALSAVESAIIERYKLYRWVSWHHKVLFYDELVARLLRKLVERPEFKRRFFTRDRDVANPEQFGAELHEALGKPLAGDVFAFPPLELFDGTKLGLEEGWYRINTDFLIDTGSHYFDDVWFLSKLRNLSTSEKEEILEQRGRIWHEAVLTRRPIGISLWKDETTYGMVSDELGSELMKNSVLTTIVGPRSVSQASAQSLFKKIDQMAKGKDAVVITFQDRLIKEIEAWEIEGAHFIVKPTRHLYFGDVSRIGIVARGGQLEDAVAISPVLAQLRQMEGQIPVYVFLVGQSDVIDRLKGDWAEVKNNFIKAVVSAIVRLAQEGQEYKELAARLLT